MSSNRLGCKELVLPFRARAGRRTGKRSEGSAFLIFDQGELRFWAVAYSASTTTGQRSQHQSKH